MKRKINIWFVSISLFVLSFAGLKAQQWDGLTLYSNMGSTLGYLIDTNSTVVKTWTFTGGTGYSTHMMPGGTIFRSVSNPGNALTGGGMTGRIQKVDYNGAVLWDYTYSSSSYCLHHDHCPLPNGNVLVISYDVKTAADATAAGCGTAMVIWSEKIMELQPVGTNSAVVVWEWKLWDHLVQNTNASAANYKASIADNPQLMNINYKTTKDWIHMNGIDYNPVLDQVALSSHNMNEWYIIDHSTTTAEAASHSGGRAGKGGDFLYRWGNPVAYGAGGSAVLNVAHDAHWVPENCLGAGDLAGVNNRGVTSPSSKTTADQIVVPRSGFNYTLTQGSAFTPSSYSARHVSTGYTSNMGCTEQFPNGNQMVCLATAGTIYEINAAGTVLWTKTTSGITPQAHRYTQCYINNTAPVQPSVTLTGSVMNTASTAAAYQWYVNGNAISGATLSSHSASVAGVYVVRTTDTNGCVYAYSAGTTFTMEVPPPPVDTRVGEEMLVLQSLSVYPNPTNGTLNLNFNNYVPATFAVRVYDLKGQEVFNVENQPEMDLSSLSAGIYIMKVSTGSGAWVNKRVVLVK